jgi:uncharacterized protein DUF6886
MQRAPAPPYRGEGPHALWHVSENPDLEHFAPHRAKTAPSDEPLVWAIDTRHLPLYWFPRDCPRCTFWAGERTTDSDVAEFLAGNPSSRIHVIEDRWLQRVREATLYAYRMPEETFSESLDTAGYWMSRELVDAIARLTVDDLVGLHAAAGIQLRTEANLWPLWDQVVASTLEFSGMRLRNALPRMERDAR